MKEIYLQPQIKKKCYLAHLKELIVKSYSREDRRENIQIGLWESVINAHIEEFCIKPYINQ